jgi:protein-L-isoaspartate(D-aspartate) O-methyltransferase
MVSGPVAALSWEEQRREMVAEIRDNAVATARYIGNKPFDPRVMEAMNAVPRHEFVPVLRKPLAYRNQP